MERVKFIRRPYIRAIVTDKENVQFAYNVKLRGGGPEIGINGTFYWYHKDQRYTNAILIDNGKIVGESSAHSWKGQPDSVLVFDDLSSHSGLWASDFNVKNAISGAGLSPNLYNPIKQGYSGSYADVWRRTYHNVLGFKDGSVWLMCVLGSRNFLLDIGREFDNAILLDGGHAGNLTTDKFGYGNKHWISQNAILIKER